MDLRDGQKTNVSNPDINCSLAGVAVERVELRKMIRKTLR